MESESSAKAGSNVSRGTIDGRPVTARELCASRKDVRELDLNGVEGRDDGNRVRDADRLVLLSPMAEMRRI